MPVKYAPKFKKAYVKKTYAKFKPYVRKAVVPRHIVHYNRWRSQMPFEPEFITTLKSNCVGLLNATATAGPS